MRCGHFETSAVHGFAPSCETRWSRADRGTPATPLHVRASPPVAYGLKRGIPRWARFLPPLSGVSAAIPFLSAARAAAPATRRQLEETRAAAVYDLLLPVLWDASTFSDAIRGEVYAALLGPRLVEFGCGTGHASLSVLTGRPDIEYHGFDRSAALVGVFAAKLKRLGRPLRSVTLVAPFPLRESVIRAHLRDRRADYLVLPRFLQCVPPYTPSSNQLHRAAFLDFCRHLVRPGGRIFIVENVRGETTDEEQGFERAWDEAVCRAASARRDELKYLLRVLDPTLADLLERRPGDQTLAATIRAKCQRTGGGRLLTLSAWRQLFVHLGLSWRELRHETLENFHLFVVRC